MCALACDRACRCCPAPGSLLQRAAGFTCLRKVLSVAEPKQAAVQNVCADVCCVAQPAKIVLAPQRKGYGVCGTVPRQLNVTTAQNLNITSIADAGAVAIRSSVADLPCPGAPLMRGWPMRLAVWDRCGAAAALKKNTLRICPCIARGRVYCLNLRTQCPFCALWR